MRIAKEDPSSSAAQAIGLISIVKELQGVTSRELNKLLRDSSTFTIHYLTEKGSLLKIDMEKLAGSLPLHLLSVLMSAHGSEANFRYLLCGVRLLHSLCDLASRNYKFEQIFLGDAKVVEQLLDLVFYMLIVLGGYRQEVHAPNHMDLMSSTLVACNLYLLTGFLSPQWQEMVPVLLEHPKVDVFIDAAFGSVRMVVRCLENTLAAYYKDISIKPSLTAERVIYYLCQQCEASLQFIQSLCQQKLFMERLLKNEDLCGKGSILFLAQSILKLHIRPSFPNRIMAAISRLKAKTLSILLSLCEAESISYLDEVASSTQSLDLAKSVALEVFDLLKKAFDRDPGHIPTDQSHPMGLVQLNAMRLVEIFSDDSNFRSYMILCFAKVLTAVISLSHGDFLSCWCSSNLPETEEDASLEYDIFAAVGWILDNTSPDVRKATDLEFNLIPITMPRASFAHHRTSLFVKFFANLHCFVPNMCEEQEKNLFVLKVLECLQMDLSNLLPGFSFASVTPKAATACKNLRSLISHAESLIPTFLNAEDVRLLRAFFGELQSLFISAGFKQNRVQEAQKGGNLKEGISENSAFPDMGQVQHYTRAYDTNEGNGNRQNQVENKGILGKTESGGTRNIDKVAPKIERSGSDTSSAKGKNVVDYMDSSELSKPNEKFELAQRKRRKRTIMNDEQVTLIEQALLDEPDMQRYAASLQFWADKLSAHGSEVTSSQLKNWLNNRKARLARTAKDVRPVAANVDNPVADKQKRPLLGFYGSPESAGQYVVLIGARSEEIGRGKVFQMHGKWHGISLDEFAICVVDVYELKVDNGSRLLYPSEATGTTFADAEEKLGVMRVLWDLSRVFVLRVE